MIQLAVGTVREIAVLGAHCDDIAIGMGATLLTLARAHPGLRVRALVLSGADTERATEEHRALAAFCPGAEVHLAVLDVPDGRAPAHWDRIKNELSWFRGSTDPDLVFAPHRGDAHQDHRLLAELVPTEFRDQLVLGYEILKWDGDTPAPVCFHRLSTELAVEKATLLLKHYPSQTHRDWFDQQAFTGLTRLRGVQCRAAHAEAFVLDKAVIDFGGS
ncbi:PIG-L family deacetylase [Nocardia brasiliensis]|uniref:PIG-L family deacetylase n=1 Tax=Nocardia brasiliensis TaxID=37326 RepID=A0A6G9XS34_NOCBR|nr:PIG-L family deacetylase [Nocardia brasiliensis]QIS03633.1 PIG-L family deacetylase [Nocardia brasiliensis]